MKKLSKLPLLLITFILVYSCGRNVEADVEFLNDTVERYIVLDDKKESKENLEEMLEILLEAEEIFSFYVDDANSDQTTLFIKLLNKSNTLKRVEGQELLKYEDLKDILIDIKTQEVDVQKKLNKY